MARHEVPLFASLWQRHETLYIGIFIIALQKLSDNKCDTANENIISERLCHILNTVCFEESRKNGCEIRKPVWEQPIQPIIDSELKGGKIRKRPDFTCTLTNTFANCDDEFEIPFHIECKRLGSPKNSWTLNKNYVVNGIKRFDCLSCEYGKRAPSGMMIGYIISMTHEAILNDINDYQKKYCPDNPAVKFISEERKVKLYQQKLNRRNVNPNLFKLFHLWVDLRKQ